MVVPGRALVDPPNHVTESRLRRSRGRDRRCFYRTWFLVSAPARGGITGLEEVMDTQRIYLLRLDLTDGERRLLADAAAHNGERFVDFVRRMALEGTKRPDTDRPRTPDRVVRLA